MPSPVVSVGDHLNLPLPSNMEELRELGTDYLTRAFHAAGTLPFGNRVVEITKFHEFFGGGMGRKLMLSVKYSEPTSSLPEELFVKFTLDFGHPLRDLFAPVMAPEVRFALLSRREGFPIAVPKCMFADYSAATTTGILITEKIPYGEGSIEPCLEKCMDHKLDDPLPYYKALTLAIATLAGSHRSGRLGDDVSASFPFESGKADVGSKILFSMEDLASKLRALTKFVDEVPQLFPGEIGSKAFLERFSQEAIFLLENEGTVRHYLNSHSDFVALCHWNMNVDNAWFWRDTLGGLQVGLLDWGSVGQMNVAQAMFGMMCAAEPAFLNQHRSTLMSWFADQYKVSGGPPIDADDLLFQTKLATALLGVAWILDAPSIINAQLPDVRVVSNRFDSRLKQNFLAHAQHHLLIVFLNEWLVCDIGGALRTVVSKA